VFGFDRGTPIDRYYIERFIADHRADIRGRVLEIGDSSYTRRFGDDRPTRCDVLHAVTGSRQATIVGDLSTGQGIPSDAFDCIILTQTLCCIFDVRAAVANIHRALCCGGVVLATVPGISQISRYDMDRWGDYWRFTSLSARRVFEEAFGTDGVRVEAHGNVASATAFLRGLAMEEMEPKELDHVDADYEMLITIRAIKSGQCR
jgi:SAM-dependent methyltransferase